MTNPLENRSSQRFPMNMDVEMNHPATGKGMTCSSRDISHSGIFVYANNPLPENSPVEFTMKLHGAGAPEEGVRVLCKGTVVRVEAPAGGDNAGIAVTIDSFRFLNGEKGNA